MYSIHKFWINFFVFYAQRGLISEKNVTIKRIRTSLLIISTLRTFFLLTRGYPSLLLRVSTERRFFISTSQWNCAKTNFYFPALPLLHYAQYAKNGESGKKCNIEPVFSLLDTVPNNLSWVRYPKEKVFLFQIWAQCVKASSHYV